jgi:uncharacterized coiled-coil DUF342 family protein
MDAYQQMFEGVKQVADGLIMANEGVKKIADGAIAAKQERDGLQEERDGLHEELADIRGTVQQLQTLVLQQTQDIRELREQIGGKQ